MSKIVENYTVDGILLKEISFTNGLKHRVRSMKNELGCYRVDEDEEYLCFIPNSEREDLIIYEINDYNMSLETFLEDYFSTEEMLELDIVLY